MIITVTANAAIDKTLTVPNFQVGFRHRASQNLTLPGGKGVNIARALKSLGQPVIATGLVGGRTGQQVVEELGREGILNDFVRIQDESRTSTAVIDPTSMSQTEINEYGPVVSDAERREFLDKVDYLGKGAHYVIIAGSLPRRLAEDFYMQLLQHIKRHRCVTVLDAAGEPLRLGMRGRPDIVSSNVREAEDLVGHEFHDEQDLVDATEMIRGMGAENVIIKKPDGCVARIKHGRRHRVFLAHIPLIETVVSTVGSGDAFIAGFISCRFQRMEIVDCLRYGVACGAANTLRYGAGVFDANEVERLYGATEVEEAKAGSRA